MLDVAQLLAWSAAGLLVAAIISAVTLMSRLHSEAGTIRVGSQVRGSVASKLLIGAASLSAVAAAIAITSRIFG